MVYIPISPLPIIKPVHPAICFKCSGPATCQVYEYQGTVRILYKKMVLVINETTMSEMKFKLPIEGEAKLAPFVDLTVKGKLTFKDKKISNRSGTITYHSCKINDAFFYIHWVFNIKDGRLELLK